MLKSLQPPSPTGPPPALKKRGVLRLSTAILICLAIFVVVNLVCVFMRDVKPDSFLKPMGGGHLKSRRGNLASGGYRPITHGDEGAQASARQPSHQAKLYPPGASLICDDEYPLCQNQYVPQFLLEHAHVGGVIIATATCPCCCCRSIAGHCSGGNATFVLQTCKVPRNVLGPGYGCWRDCSE